jgi:hypothetical protein
LSLALSNPFATLEGMPCRLIFTIILGLTAFAQAFSQTVGQWLPEKINAKDSYLFYFHGGIVTRLGNNAIQQSYPEWGPYQYLNILDSLSTLGFHVISENRKENIDNSVYVNQLAKQVDTLLRARVDPKKIIIVGASAGSDIVLNASPLIYNKHLHYVIMGACRAETYKDYKDIKLVGNFLSIIEESDPHKTCSAIFKKRVEVSSFKEVELHTGLSHGFFFKPRKVWIEPILMWFRK